jgi:hypothetical protein
MSRFLKNTSTWAAGAFFLVALTGCPPRDEATPETNGQLEEWWEETKPAVEDATITARILSRLAADGDVSVFDIEVSTERGVVTLQGTVESEEQRLRAEALAEETSGVVRVENRIVVEPLGPDDDTDTETDTEPVS